MQAHYLPTSTRFVTFAICIEQQHCIGLSMFRVSTDSPLRNPPCPISERQAVLLDGVRYSADMAGIAIDRLWRQLCLISSAKEGDIRTHHIAEAALDAWSIIDAAHRMFDLVNGLPGLRNSSWRRTFEQRMSDALELRNMWQHQKDEAQRIVEERGQTWGALAWAEHKDDQPTGRWFLVVVGSALSGSQWFHAGPHKAIPRVGTRRIRLLHLGKEVYLARLVRDMFEALHHLEVDVSEGGLSLRGPKMDQPRPSDWVAWSVIEVIAAYQDRSGS